MFFTDFTLRQSIVLGFIRQARAETPALRVGNRSKSSRRCDIMQECSVDPWRRFDTYDEKRAFTGWALGFVRMEIRRFLQRSSQRTQLIERAAASLLQDLQTHTEQLEAPEQHLKHCVERLKYNHRKLIRAYSYEERSVGGLSQFSKCSIEAIYKFLQRIRQELQSCIELRLRRTTGREGLHEGKRLWWSVASLFGRYCHEGRNRAIVPAIGIRWRGTFEVSAHSRSPWYIDDTRGIPWTRQ